MRKRVTSKDVAEKAAVSRTTVSLVLNNVGGIQISPDTRQRVIDAANELGYVPDATAQALASRRAKAIGLVMTRNPHHIASDSTNRGVTWEKMNEVVSVRAQYYSEIFCDPVDVNKVYLLDTFSQITTDGGKTFTPISTKGRHVDDHAFWINPNNANHYLIGGDGGIYETFDGAQTFHFKDNLPITQFYRVSVDNFEPFYRVMGGTQDNNSMIVPSQTINEEGIVNADYIPLVGGDGYEAVTDPENPNIIYCLWQYGGLTRHDLHSGEITSIKPQEGKDETPYRWNWDTPLMISPHANRL